MVNSRAGGQTDRPFVSEPFRYPSPSFRPTGSTTLEFSGFAWGFLFFFFFFLRRIDLIMNRARGTFGNRNVSTSDSMRFMFTRRSTLGQSCRDGLSRKKITR
ncbi:hypothetical protein VTN02DRAFT_5504 [Thermoascus thermophilus]